MVFVRRNTITELTHRKEFVKYFQKVSCDDIRSDTRALSVFRRKQKRFAVYEEQNMAVCGMHDPHTHSDRRHHIYIIYISINFNTAPHVLKWHILTHT